MGHRFILATALIAMTAILMASGPDQDVLIVHDDPDVYTADLPPFDGIGHGDGIASLRFHGTAVQIVSGEERPVPDVRFSVVPDRSFAEGNNSRIIFLSNDDGQFLSQLYVGAAMTMGGANPGTVYQTRRAKLKIEKPGFKTKYLWVDYDMPVVKIIMEPAAGT